jgi:hypothetical protein
MNPFFNFEIMCFSNLSYNFFDMSIEIISIITYDNVYIKKYIHMFWNNANYKRKD